MSFPTKAEIQKHLPEYVRWVEATHNLSQKTVRYYVQCILDLIQDLLDVPAHQFEERVTTRLQTILTFQSSFWNGPAGFMAYWRRTEASPSLSQNNGGVMSFPTKAEVKKHLPEYIRWTAHNRGLQGETIKHHLLYIQRLIDVSPERFTEEWVALKQSGQSNFDTSHWLGQSGFMAYWNEAKGPIGRLTTEDVINLFPEYRTWVDRHHDLRGLSLVNFCRYIQNVIGKRGVSQMVIALALKTQPEWYTDAWEGPKGFLTFLKEYSASETPTEDTYNPIVTSEDNFSPNKKFYDEQNNPWETAMHRVARSLRIYDSENMSAEVVADKIQDVVQIVTNRPNPWKEALLSVTNAFGYPPEGDPGRPARQFAGMFIRHLKGSPSLMRGRTSRDWLAAFRKLSVLLDGDDLVKPGADPDDCYTLMAKLIRLRDADTQAKVSGFKEMLTQALAARYIEKEKNTLPSTPVDDLLRKLSQIPTTPEA